MRQMGAVIGSIAFTGSLAILLLQPTRPVNGNRHLSSPAILITFNDDSKQEALLLGIGTEYQYDIRQWCILTDAGTTRRLIWPDDLKMIVRNENLTNANEGFAVVLRDGQQVRASFGYNLTCDRIPNDLQAGSVCRFLHASGRDGGTQIIDLENVKSVEFVGPERKLGAGNAVL